MKTTLPPLRPVANVSELHRLAQADGQSCRGHLTEMDGRLYGLAGECGPLGIANCNSSASWNTTDHTLRCPGSLFSIALDGSDFRVDHAFTQLSAGRRNADGYHPWGSLVALDGWLYGTTQMGGEPTGAVAPGYVQPGCGVLFRCQPDTGEFETLHAFFGVPGALDGYYPSGDIAIGPDGALYGTCKDGGTSRMGTVWRWHGALSYASMSTAAGICYGGMTLANGKLHGCSSHGGEHGRGSYFTVDPSTLEIAVVDSFDTFVDNAHGNDNTPIQAPLLLSDGTLVMARAYAGPFGCGFVCRLGTDGITALCQCEDIPLAATPRFSNHTGAMMLGALVEGADGLIYGTCTYGGAQGCGGVYRIARDGSLFQLVYSFSLAGPCYPYGGLMRASNGSLYTVTFNNGAILRIDPPTS